MEIVNIEDDDAFSFTSILLEGSRKSEAVSVDDERDLKSVMAWLLFSNRLALPQKQDKNSKEDALLMKLAKEKHWRRCPRCEFFVEHSSGCNKMKCRCGHRFCYSCGGAKWPKSAKCGCGLYGRRRR